MGMQQLVSLVAVGLAQEILVQGLDRGILVALAERQTLVRAVDSE